MRDEQARGGTLVVQPLPGIGDMVWHLPLIHGIAAASPDGQVSILTKPRSRADELFAENPAVRQVLWVERKPGRHDGLLGFWRLTQLLKQGNFAHVWILHGSSRYAWAAYLAGIPLRTGYGRGMQRYLLNDPVQLPQELQREHPILRAQRLLELKRLPMIDPEPNLAIGHSALASVNARFEHYPKPWIAFGIGSSEAYKQWGTDNFAQLAESLGTSRQASIFLLGGKAEEAMAEAIAARLADKPIRLVPALSLPLDQAAALLSCCQLCVANDTGVLNLAAAAGIHSLGLFGGSPALTHSRRIHAIVPKDLKLKMQGISVDAVAAFSRTLGTA
jgi:heptosyltransferase-2